MAKCIYICSRDILTTDIDAKLTNICNRLSPDNIESRAPYIRRSEKMAFAVTNPTENITINKNCLLLGVSYSSINNWQKPLEQIPNGSFALFRSSDQLFEVVSDAAASRTIWYYFDEYLFISSTSQRAIIMFINSFEFNENVIPWMLSSGSLGPEYSWDKRIKRIPPNSSVILNKKEWNLTEKKNRIEFKEKKVSDKEHKSNLYKKLNETFDHLQIDYSKWYLPLSGGYDSRGILCFLIKNQSNRNNLKTITWGLSTALKDIATDAYVAKELSKYYQISNKYYSTDKSDESTETIYDRFLKLGEGRVDHISGYMDGFKIWKTLYEDGIEGIIRGDEGFGWNDNAYSPLYIRKSTGSTLCKDFSNLCNYRKYGIPKQKKPEVLKRRKKETLPMMRDRIYHEFRLPTIIAGLTDLKLSYVEQVSPLLSKSILDYVRQLPDHLRTDKFLFKEIIDNIGPNIEYASKNAIANPRDILKSKDSTTLFIKILSSDQAKNIFQDKFLNIVLNNIIPNNSKNKIKASGISKEQIMNLTPNFLINLIRNYIIKPKLDYNVIAFRIYIICKMHEILIEDSTFYN